MVVSMDSRQQAQLTKILEDDDGDEPVDEDLLLVDGHLAAGHPALELFPSSPLVESPIIDSSSDLYKNLSNDYQQQQQQNQTPTQRPTSAASQPITPITSTTQGDPQADSPASQWTNDDQSKQNNQTDQKQQEPANQLGNSKYRRRTANARERIRMREINQAFEKLKQVVPIELMQGLVGSSSGDESDCHQLTSSSGKSRSRQSSSSSGEAAKSAAGEQQPKLTKINTLRLAISYIAKLSEVLESHPENGSSHEMPIRLISRGELASDQHETKMAPAKRSAKRRRRSALADEQLSRVNSSSRNKRQQNRGLNSDDHQLLSPTDSKLKSLPPNDKLADNDNSPLSFSNYSDNKFYTTTNDSNKSIERGNFKLVQLIEHNPSLINNKQELIHVQRAPGYHEPSNCAKLPTHKLIFNHQPSSQIENQQHFAANEQQLVKLAPSFGPNFRPQQPAILLSPSNQQADEQKARQLQQQQQQILIASPNGQLLHDFRSRAPPNASFLNNGTQAAGDRTFVTPIAVAILGIHTTAGAGQQMPSSQQVQLLGLNQATGGQQQQAPQQVTLALNDLNGLSVLRLAAPGQQLNNCGSAAGACQPQYVQANYQQPLVQRQVVAFQQQQQQAKQLELRITEPVGKLDAPKANKPELEEDKSRGQKRVSQTANQQPKRILRWHNYDGNMITNHLYSGSGQQLASSNNNNNQTTKTTTTAAPATGTI